MKILVSTDFGAGWSTWHDGLVADTMLTYGPIIEAIESGVFTYRDDDPAVKQLLDDLGADDDDDNAPYVCTRGARDLVVVDVNEQFRVLEYDGRETVELSSDIVWRTPK